MFKNLFKKKTPKFDNLKLSFLGLELFPNEIYKVVYGVNIQNEQDVQVDFPIEVENPNAQSVEDIIIMFEFGEFASSADSKEYVELSNSFSIPVQRSNYVEGEYEYSTIRIEYLFPNTKLKLTEIINSRETKITTSVKVPTYEEKEIEGEIIEVEEEAEVLIYADFKIHLVIKIFGKDLEYEEYLFQVEIINSKNPKELISKYVDRLKENKDFDKVENSHVYNHFFAIYPQMKDFSRIGINLLRLIRGREYSFFVQLDDKSNILKVVDVEFGTILNPELFSSNQVEYFLIENKQSSIKAVKLVNFKSKIENLVTNNKINEAIYLLKEYLIGFDDKACEELTLLETTYNLIQKNKRLGLLNNDDYLLQSSKMIHSLLNYVYAIKLDK